MQLNKTKNIHLHYASTMQFIKSHYMTELIMEIYAIFIFIALMKESLSNIKIFTLELYSIASKAAIELKNHISQNQ